MIVESINAPCRASAFVTWNHVRSCSSVVNVLSVRHFRLAAANQWRSFFSSQPIFALLLSDEFFYTSSDFVSQHNAGRERNIEKSCWNFHSHRIHGLSQLSRLLTNGTHIHSFYSPSSALPMSCRMLAFLVRSFLFSRVSHTVLLLEQAHPVARNHGLHSLALILRFHGRFFISMLL